MKKNIFIIVILLISIVSINAQSAKMKAQARYYTALNAYKSKNYSKALIASRESKEILGGTNFKLQYVHIVSAYKAGQYNESFQEIERYFLLYDKEEKALHFRAGAEDLTNDETDEILKLYDVVQDKKNKQEAEEVRLAKEKVAEKLRITKEKKAERLSLIKMYSDPSSVTRIFKRIINKSSGHKVEFRREGVNEYHEIKYGLDVNGPNLKFSKITIDRDGTPLSRWGPYRFSLYYEVDIKDIDSIKLNGTLVELKLKKKVSYHSNFTRKGKISNNTRTSDEIIIIALYKYYKDKSRQSSVKNEYKKLINEFNRAIYGHSLSLEN